MNENYFVNEEGYKCYKLDCGCEGIEVPPTGWQNILCDRHEEEYQEMLEKPIHFKKTKMRPSREI